MRRLVSFASPRAKMSSNSGSMRAEEMNFSNLKHSRVHPKFLHSNSTSHRWVFGAIAELLDNAMDPDVLASQVMIDLQFMKNQENLIIMDNGFGMTAEKLHRMLGFGHSEKSSKVIDGRIAIGRYGNGFKSGSMRIGKDALVLTKCKDSQSVGLLSQSFLNDIGAEDVFIPLLSWDLDGTLRNQDELEVKEGLAAISKYSIFDSEEELLSEFDAIAETGTMIIISQLRMVGEELELDGEQDEADIRIRNFTPDQTYQQSRTNQGMNVNVPLDYSLRAYCSVLYKIPRMQIFLRGKKVLSKRVSGLLTERMADSYRPYSRGEAFEEEVKLAKFEFGFNTDSSDLYGVMMYHNNRLIRPYVRVGIQLEANTKGIGVLGIVDANFLIPTHNKQSFDDTKEYRSLLKKLAETLNVFWWDKVESRVERESTTTRRPKKKAPDVLWVQCEYPKCLKWRTLPPGTDMSKLPKVWFCHMHPNKAIAESKHEYPEETWEDQTIVEETKKRKRDWQAARKAKRLAEEQRRNEEVRKLQEEQQKRAREFEEMKNKQEAEVSKLRQYLEMHKAEQAKIKQYEKMDAAAQLIESRNAGDDRDKEATANAPAVLKDKTNESEKTDSGCTIAEKNQAHNMPSSMQVTSAAPSAPKTNPKLPENVSQKQESEKAWLYEKHGVGKVKEHMRDLGLSLVLQCLGGTSNNTVGSKSAEKQPEKSTLVTPQINPQEKQTVTTASEAPGGSHTTPAPTMAVDSVDPLHKNVDQVISAPQNGNPDKGQELAPAAIEENVNIACAILSPQPATLTTHIPEQTSKETSPEKLEIDSVPSPAPAPAEDSNKSVGNALDINDLFDAIPEDATADANLKVCQGKMRTCLNILFHFARMKSGAGVHYKNTGGITRILAALGSDDKKLTYINIAKYIQALGLDSL